MKTIIGIVRGACALAAVALLAGCGESPQVASYQDGRYQGKTDTRPWESAAYGGDKARWESDMRARTGYQNELRRAPD